MKRQLDADGAKCKEIRPMLKELDKAFDITFNYDTEKYHVTHNGRLFQTVPYGEFSRDLIAEIRHTLWLNVNGNVIDYVEKNNDKVAAAEDRARQLYTESLAKDIRRPLINNYYYGV